MRKWLQNYETHILLLSFKSYFINNLNNQFNYTNFFFIFRKHYLRLLKRRCGTVVPFNILCLINIVKPE